MYLHINHMGSCDPQNYSLSAIKNSCTPLKWFADSKKHRSLHTASRCSMESKDKVKTFLELHFRVDA